MVGTAKTVLGPVSASQLGITHTHAHLLLTFSAAKEDMPDLYDIEALAGPLIDDLGKAVRQYKIKTLVDAAPEALGRDVDLWQLVARQLNINVIAATGFYRQRGGVAGYWGYQEEDQYEEFILRELTEGVGPNKVQCGVIKIAWTGEPPGDPEPVELKATHAAARASRQTGAPVVAHCSFRADSNRNLGLEQVKMLMENGA
ncbi:MAG: hypothetical protein HYY31_04895, partial [Chloroflexi bacterium]|nr:hypothetical protein [Chloroflexota bacterium]